MRKPIIDLEIETSNTRSVTSATSNSMSDAVYRAGIEGGNNINDIIRSLDTVSMHPSRNERHTVRATGTAKQRRGKYIGGDVEYSRFDDDEEANDDHISDQELEDEDDEAKKQKYKKYMEQMKQWKKRLQQSQVDAGASISPHLNRLGDDPNDDDADDDIGDADDVDDDLDINADVDAVGEPSTSEVPRDTSTSGISDTSAVGAAGSPLPTKRNQVTNPTAGMADKTSKRSKIDCGGNLDGGIETR
uniref:Uncharacterized protein n=1 Tax=Lygus hesperus TaxID=30085 RepID=A0A0A9YIY2_LYGHE